MSMHSQDNEVNKSLPSSYWHNSLSESHQNLNRPEKAFTFKQLNSLVKKPILGKEEEQNIIELKSSFIPPINSNKNNDTKERLNINKENNNTINSIFERKSSGDIEEDELDENGSQMRFETLHRKLIKKDKLVKNNLIFF